MTAGQPARLVTDCQRLATASTESSATRLTFPRRGGLTFDGHEPNSGQLQATAVGMD